MRRPLAPALALALALAGCTLPQSAPDRASVDPPRDGGGFAECHTSAASQLALRLSGRAVNDSGGRSVGIHRLDADRFLWVWASYNATLREDAVSRIQGVLAYAEPDPATPVVLCARVDLTTPIEVDREARRYDVAVLIEATDGAPEGPVRVIVNWLAGCPCATFPSGNATALFDATTNVPETVSLGK